MKHDREEPNLVNSRTAELLAIEKRVDLTDEEKNALISAKLREYKQHPYIPTPVDGEQKPGTVSGGENGSQDQEMEARRARFDQALREGRIRVRPLVEE